MGTTTCLDGFCRSHFKPLVLADNKRVITNNVIHNRGDLGSVW